jgi:hypothetical protein
MHDEGYTSPVNGKRYRLHPDRFQPLAPGWGGCIATDRITVDGCPVGYMYRQVPRNDLDSGWRFLAGDEDEAYMADLGNHSVYEVNTIANYDPSIVDLLDSPFGAAFARDPLTGELLPDEPVDPE